MGHKFFECYGSHFKQSFDEHSAIDKNDNLNIVNGTGISEISNEILDKTKPSHFELIASLMELNTKELYEVVLHVIIHYIGLEKTDIFQTFLLTFAQKVFKIDQKNHDAIYKSAKEKKVSIEYMKQIANESIIWYYKNISNNSMKPPNFMLNIEVISGKNIEPKDPNGMSDPFCALYLSSNKNSKYYTTYKLKTLEPVWEECFSLPVENQATDVLILEVWDFDPIETIKQKISKINEVKGFKGARKYLKNIAQSAMYCKHNEELIGSTKIPLITIHNPSKKIWYHVAYNERHTGSVLMKLSFSTLKNKQVSFQEYKHLLRIFLAYQINEQKIEMYSWMGNLLLESDLIIRQHASHSHINSIDEYLGQWLEYINIHLIIPVIHSQVFLNLIHNLVKPITLGLLSEDKLQLFWTSTKKMLPLWFNDIRTIRQKSSENEIIKIQNILNILQHLRSLNLPEDLDLFIPDMYNWLLPCENTRDIRCMLHDAIIQGAMDWYKYILEKNHPQYSTEKEKMKRLLKVINHLKLDVQRALQLYEEMFNKNIQLSYSSILFSIYGDKISDICEPFITKVCQNMESINFETTEQIDKDPLEMGVTLFELYIGIQQFFELKNIIGDLKHRVSPLCKYHLWFKLGVIRWFEIAKYKTNVYIERAVKLDKLHKVYSIVKYSSSAVDTLEIFNQIKIFWKQLAWPDPESSYSFIATIINDICMCSLNYSKRMSNKVNHTIERNKIFKFTKEWCLGVNNIDHINQYIRIFANDLGLREIIESLAHYKSNVEIDNCQKKINSVINDAVNTLNKTIENLLLQVVKNKLIPEISKLLVEHEKTTHDVNNTLLEDLMQYLSENISTLNKELNEENFQLILDIIVEQIVTLTFKLIDENFKKKNPISYLKNLKCSFHEVLKFLRDENETNYKCEKIQELEELLYLHTLDTKDLIHEYYLKRHQEQNELKEANEGVLTVKLIFNNNILKVEILNAHRLRPMDSNGFSDPFVEVCLLPQYKFSNIKYPKTAVQKKCLSPLFDAFFQIPLTLEQRALENGMVMFKIQDEDLMGFKNEYISETFVHFQDIPFTPLETNMENLPQTKLFMSVPKTLDMNVLNVLKSRSTDHLAKYFFGQIKSKIIASTRKYKK